MPLGKTRIVKDWEVELPGWQLGREIHTGSCEILERRLATEIL